MAGQPDPGRVRGPTLHIWGSDREFDAKALRPDRDLVLQSPHGRAGGLERGVLLDDWLSLSDREEIDREADLALQRWRAERDGQLEIDGVPLPWIYEIQLITDVFIPTVRAARGVEHAVAGIGPERVVLEGIDPLLARFLAEMLRASGIDAQVGSTGPAPDYPIAFPVPHATGARQVAALLRRTVGAPQRIRGSVLVMPFWHLAPLWARLGGSPSTRPLIDLATPPRGGAGDLAALMHRGGWIGHPNAVDRARSRRVLARGLGALYGEPGPWLDGLLDQRALAFLGAVARDSAALFDRLRRAFAHGLRVVVVPTDVSPFARLAAVAGRNAGTGSLVQVQHGHISCLPGPRGEPQSWVDGMAAQRVAVWSDRALAQLAPRAPGQVVCTGNPGGLGFEVRGGTRAAGHTLVLVQLPTAITCKIDTRATSGHLDAALAGLAATRPGTSVTIRPHPLDREREDYARRAALHPGLRVVLDATTPIGELARRSDLCVGSISTATLQAAGAGVPTVFLDTTGVATEWPLGDGGPIPSARDAAGLASVIADRVGAPEIPGRDAALEALGVSDDALDRLVALITDAVA